MTARILFLLAVLLMAGCALDRPATVRQAFLLQPQRLSGVVAPSTGIVLKIGHVQIVSPFDGRAFVYRRDAARYETDFYNEFSADPADQVAAAVAEWLQQSGCCRRVLESQTMGISDYRLDAAIAALYIDFTLDRPQAVLDLRWRLLKDNRVIAELASTEREPLSQRNPAGIVAAHRANLAKSLTALEGRLAGWLAVPANE